MKVAVIISVFNRPNYVKQCFDSLRASNVPHGTMFVIVDDGSTEELPEFHGKHKWLTNEKNMGVKASLLRGIDSAFSIGADLIINLDSDGIVKPDFIQRLTALHTPDRICGGFNNQHEPILETHDTYYIKAHCNGINMCFDRAQYEQHIKPALLSTGNWDFNTAGPFALTRPSCVQHIGLQSSLGHTGADVAPDFKLLDLPNVTLFGVDTRTEGLQRAADICQLDIQFGAVNILTGHKFTGDVKQAYSKFMIKELAAQFSTSHVLVIQADGYVLNAGAWRNEWLEFDFIGASWGYKDGMNCGNGGFSLRSKKLCDLLAEYELGGGHFHPEDFHIGRTYRPALEKLGIKFAPDEVCNKFSIEAYGSSVFPSGNLYSGSFGFHSVHVDFSTAEQYGVPKDILYKRK